MKHNGYWGDIMKEKQQNITRIYSINVNGIQLDKRGGKFNEICACIKETQSDIFCIQEHNLDVNQSRVRSILHDTGRQHWDRVRLNAGTSPVVFATQYKPGGTMILSNGNITGRIFKHTQDRLGRWVTTSLHGKGNSKLTIFSIYQVVITRSETGSISAAKQQRALLLQDGDEVTGPRDAFKRDLKRAVQQQQQEGFEVILIGDFNEEFVSSGGIEQMANELGLLHLLKHRHSQKLPATYARGTKCIDYALGSERWQLAIAKAGYEPFNARIHTDHRGFYLDFNTDILFGMETPQLSSKASRQLQSWNPRQVSAYLDHVHDLLTKQNAFERGYKLEQPGNRHEVAERLDKDLCDISLIAEKRTHRYQEPDWSVSLAEARKRVCILNKTLSAFRTKTDLTYILQNDMRMMNEPFQLPTTREECSAALRKAKQEVLAIVKTSFERREEERDRRIKILEQSHNQVDKETVRHLKQQRRTEKVRHLFRKLKGMQSKSERRGVTRIEIPIYESQQDVPQGWKEIDVPDEILHHLTIRNKKHFGQAAGTPFTVSPLSDDLKFHGDTTAGEEILSGTYKGQLISEDVQLLISHLKRCDSNHLHTRKTTINVDEFVSKLKVWPESTTTSPSGLHLGHYKALIARHLYSLSANDEQVLPEFVEQRRQLERKQQDILRLRLQLLNYALARGYSYRRWQVVVNMVLFKDSDNYRIDRTRIIHLYEADYNMALGIMWRSAIHQAEDRHLLNEGQYGSRPGRRAADPVMLEEMIYEISRATRDSVAQVSYDAKACYDRIIPALAMLASRKFGVPKPTTVLNARTLERAEYRLKTDTGIAESGYRHDLTQPIYGTGQGSGNSPAIWCFISCILFECYDDSANPAVFADPTQTLQVRIGMTGFVDDCGGYVTETHPEPGKNRTQLTTKVQENAQQWTNLLSASGGALELSKCSCHMITWQFSIQGAPLMTPVNKMNSQKIKVIDPHTGVEHSLEQWPNSKAHKTLGHFKEPMGTQIAQFEALKAKSDSITQFLWEKPLARSETWTYYQACYLPAVTYPLSASSMTPKQLYSIQKKAMSILVARCGFNRHTKKEVLYGPKSLGGAGFRDLYVEQGIGQILQVIRHWRQSTTVGNLMRIALSWYQLATGVSYPLLERPEPQLPHLESVWFKSLRQFLAKMQGSLRLGETFIPPRQREHDAYIMDIVLESKKFSDSEIRRINYCRLHLQVVTISDIATTRGDGLDPLKIRGEIQTRGSSSRLVWPTQDKPSAATWAVWKRANRLWTTDSGKLKRPLGRWLVPHNVQRQEHYAYASTQRIWRWTPEGYSEFRRVDDGIQPTGILVEAIDIPHDATPVQVQEVIENKWYISGGSATVPSPSLTAKYSTFEKYVDTLDPARIKLLRHTEFLLDPRAIDVKLEFGLRAASDGSVWESGQGAFGWILSSDRGERVARGSGPVETAEQTPSRAEATALLSLLTFLAELHEFLGKHEEWEGRIATDGQGILMNLEKWTPQVSSGTRREAIQWYKTPYHETELADWDILAEIYHQLQRLPKVTIEFVKGHQDRQRSTASLELLAQLNVEADALAKRFQKHHGRPHPIAQIRQHTGVLLDLPDGTVTANVANVIRQRARGEDLLAYMKKKYEWSDHTAKIIHWSAHAEALKNHSKKHTHMVKMIHDVLPTNSRLHRKDTRRQQCPGCPEKKEDQDHVLRCPSDTRLEARQNLLRKMEEACQGKQTDPQLQDILLKALKAWMDGKGNTEIAAAFENLREPYTTLIRQQTAIGWRQLWNGRFASKWAELQEQHYGRMDMGRFNRAATGDKWLANTIGELWAAWMIIWETRNKDLHGHDLSSQAMAARRSIQEDIRAIYEVKHMLEPSVRDMLEDDAAAHQNRAIWVNRNWLAVHGPLVKSSIRKFKSGIMRGVRSIKDYFGAAV